RLCRAGSRRRRQRLAAIWRRVLHRRRIRGTGLDLQRGEGRARVGADRGARVSAPAGPGWLAASLLLAVVLAGLLSAVITRMSLPLLQRYALARPNARSSHHIPTPQGAGIAVIAATLLVASMSAAWSGIAIPLELLVGTVLIALVGFADDI